MGSYCAIQVDGHDLFSAKSVVPDHFISLFQESDRRETQDPDSDVPNVAYVASRAAILDRLDLLGITLDAAQASFNHWMESRRSDFQVYVEEQGEQFFKDELALLDQFGFEEWGKRARWALQHRYDHGATSPDAIGEKMLESDNGWFVWPSSDERLILRAYLEAVPDVVDVTLDLAALIQGGYIDCDAFIETSRAMAASIQRDIETIVVIGEGVSDSRILQASLRSLFPETTDYFSFFDHSELSVDGGASYLVKFLRAFATARISTRLVAVFDNDAAGSDAFADARKLKLPDNIVPFRLPDIALAKNYPTVGPQGSHLVDVNGSGVGIEMFLGCHNLQRVDGSLRPVVYTGWRSKAGIYQGAIEKKEDVADAFFDELREPVPAMERRAKYPELVQLWGEIFNMVRQANASAVMRLEESFTEIF